MQNYFDSKMSPVLRVLEQITALSQEQGRLHFELIRGVFGPVPTPSQDKHSPKRKQLPFSSVLYVLGVL